MAISDKVVAKALAAYESAPPLTGHFERMRLALEAVAAKPKPAETRES